MSTKLTQSRLQELLYYNPHSGDFVWRVSAGSVCAGTVAVGKNADGYTVIQVDGCKYGAHRLAWLYVHGVWPTEIDHINCVREDNSLDNLRVVSREENMQNKTKAHKNSKLGVLGVSRWGNKYRASIKAAGKRYDLGLHNTIEEASAAYSAAKLLYHGLKGEK